MPSSDRDASLLCTFTLHLLETLQELGYDPTPFMQRHKLRWQHLKQASARLPCATYFDLVEDILSETQHPGLGLEAGKNMTLIDQGLLGYTLYSCENLGKAFELYQKYGDTMGQSFRGLLHTDNKHAYFTQMHTESELQSRPAVLRYEVEMEFSLWLKLGQALSSQNSWWEEIHLTFPEPNYSDLYQQQFACPLLFEQPYNQFVFAKALLDKPFDTFNPTTADLLEVQCAELFKELSHQGGFSGEIQHLLARCAGRYPDIKQVCEHFNISESTLRRRLTAEGTSYKQLLLSFRLELACRYLKETQLSITEIAYLVGYTEPVNFFRAFQRKLRTTPQAYRSAETSA